MRKIISFMHVSLDGFVAGPNGEHDFVSIDDSLYDHIGKRIRETDTALYGRVTYELMQSYWPTIVDKPNPTKHEMEHYQWYAKAHRIVLSKSMTEEGLTNTTVISDNLVDRIREIREQVGGEVLVFGSPSATHSLLQLDLIDGFWLFVNPIILGRGIPLFNGIKNKVKLQLLSSRQFDKGVVELNYRVD